MAEVKRKLRTAADVISRLKWDSDSFGVDNRDDLVFGFNDRIHGPLEKSLQDYVPASQDGDIPEHRINYFRRGADVLWDRRSRLDKIFGSSGEATAVVCAETLSDMKLAKETGDRLTLEREIRLEERIKRSHKKQGKVHLNDHKVGASTDRHVWTARKIEACTKGDPTTLQPVDRFRILTWNVLFDLYDKEPADERWRLSIKRIGDEMADIVLLQEVTPQYARTLLECDWFVENYHASTSLGRMVERFGNLILWKRSVFALASSCETGIFACHDGIRNRAVLGVLQNGRHIFIVSNVHLPADHAMVASSDQNNVISPSDRRAARQRERAAMIAKSQVLQELYESKGYSVTCIMGGDFNIVEEVEVLGGRFSSFFRDAWTECSTDPGYTYDPDVNVRAISNKGPRRIDRIFLGDTLREQMSEQSSPITSVAGSIIGTLGDVGADRCPSDHYGVMIDCKINPVGRPVAVTSQKAWSCCSHSSTDTLLALCFDRHDLSDNLCDIRSSLPVPHVTLIHGFVELNNDESRYLALRSIEETITRALEGRSFPLLFDESSLSVFEHRASSSVVYLPTPGSEANNWLQTLYSTLRAVFPQCDDQEVRFDSGWRAHRKWGNVQCAIFLTLWQ
jgi:poly(A) polymerase